ncbi:MAG: hypothetical protein J7M18_08880 [Candidatus Eremiobacteraeota bacterium]|nr:hypothetical protein [Candidatus Eremiobacteraeota bacterium]
MRKYRIQSSAPKNIVILGKISMYTAICSPFVLILGLILINIFPHNIILGPMGLIFVFATIIGIIFAFIAGLISLIITEGDEVGSKIGFGYGCIGMIFLGWLLFHLIGQTQAMKDLERCKSNMQKIGIAIDKYAEDHDGQYPESLSDIVPDYIDSLPECPSSKLTESYGYVLSEAQKEYTIYCKGENAHKRAGIQTGWPQYNSWKGLFDHP